MFAPVITILGLVGTNFGYDSKVSDFSDDNRNFSEKICFLTLSAGRFVNFVVMKNQIQTK